MKYLTYILIFITLFSCKNDDDATVNIPDVNTFGLEGKWNLVAVTGGFLGVDHIFESGTIVWDFDETSKIITVVNNNSDTNLEDSLPTGTYNYSIQTLDDVQELIINDISIGNLSLNNNTLIIDEQFRDGFLFTFQR
ncbi:hypothetical protein [Aquimarina mytili]|uniref:Lipocalin-like domain-containing protein n=1 Tax=Aquimarina mytili TaxID=874423 RepID=A0A937A0Y7_9FLAO|nr:hypothetical protein [Aquimarina mytili]MBL0683015.1 hypothetical protein [Aquimarina mytili]